jgi:hypothetical protein
VTLFVRQRQPTIAALASSRWLLCSSKGDVLDGDHAIANVARQSPTVGARTSAHRPNQSLAAPRHRPDRRDRVVAETIVGLLIGADGKCDRRSVDAVVIVFVAKRKFAPARKNSRQVLARGRRFS